MRILLHGINYSPELTGIGKYTGEMASWFAAQGHDVRVVTAPPYYPQWQITPGYANRWQVEQTAGVVVYRCPLWVPSKVSGLKRIIHLASFAVTSLPIMLWQIFWKPDVVWVVEPPLFCAPQALLVAKLSGAKACLHIQDYEVDAAFDLGLLKGQAVRNAVTLGERCLLRLFDKVTTISQRMIDRALSKGLDADKVALFPNWVDLSHFAYAADDHNSAYRAELGIPADAIVALYSGNMGNKQGLDILAQAASLCGSAVFFVFCGNGTGRADLVDLCKDLPNVLFLDLQPVARLGEFLAIADIHLLPQRADAADLVMPSKLTGMFASGRPVIAMANAGTELSDVVSRRGLLIEPENAGALVKAINTLADDKALRVKLGAPGRLYAETHLGIDAVLSRFEKILFKIIEK